MRSVRLAALLLGIAAASIGARIPAHGAVRVTKTVRPAVLVTLYAISADDDSVTVCFPMVATCPLAVHGAALTLDPDPGTLVVGFERFIWLGTDPCPCNGYEVLANRGMAVFNTRDIPHHFVKATLALSATATDADNAQEDVISGLFEGAPAAPLMAESSNQNSDAFSNAEVELDDATGQTTILLRTDQDLSRTGPFAPPLMPLNDPVYSIGANNPKVERNGFSYRLDVTDRVRKWVANWPNRNSVPLHSFILQGWDESLPTDNPSNSHRAAMYRVTLEFDIDEPDF